MKGKAARNHSAKSEASWYRVGFSFDAAMTFFDLLRAQFDPMHKDSDRWLAMPSAEFPQSKEVLPEKDSALQAPPPALLAAASGVDQLDADANQASVGADIDATIAMMLNHAQRASEESGKERVTVRKPKQHQFADDEEFRRHVSALMEQQQYRCSITGLNLHFLGDAADPEQLASLDRIDSNGTTSPEICTWCVASSTGGNKTPKITNSGG